MAWGDRRLFRNAKFTIIPAAGSAAHLANPIIYDRSSVSHLVLVLTAGSVFVARQSESSRASPRGGCSAEAEAVSESGWACEPVIGYFSVSSYSGRWR